MAQSGRFELGLKVLAVLAADTSKSHTSAAIGEVIGTSAVMVRRVFAALHGAGFIAQRKGPQGGARLKHGAKSIGLGDVYIALEPAWLLGGEGVDASIRKLRADAVKAMNDTSLATVAKRIKKSAAAE